MNRSIPNAKYTLPAAEAIPPLRCATWTRNEAPSAEEGQVLWG